MSKTKMTRRKYKKTLSKKQMILVALAVVLLAGGWLYLSKRDNKAATNEPLTAESESTINLDPPTEEEQQAGDAKKNEIINDQATQAESGGQANKSATVIITDAGQYDDAVEVRAFIPDHYQDGTCTFTFTQGSQTVTKSTPAYRDASTTICTNPVFNRSEFPSAGKWQVIVSYKSTNASGQSSPTTITIN